MEQDFSEEVANVIGEVIDFACKYRTAVAAWTALVAVIRDVVVRVELSELIGVQCDHRMLEPILDSMEVLTLYFAEGFDSN